MKKPATVHSLADVRHVRAMLAEAEPVAAVRAVDPVPGRSRNGINPGDWTPDPLTRLPPDCPVTPLGISGDRLWLLDDIGQVRALDPPYGKGHLLGLFCGRDHYLQWAWPRYSEGGEIAGFKAEEAAAALIRACASKGPWQAVDKVRGRGCWTDGGGAIVVHTGNTIVMGGRGEPPGEYDGHVYPTRARIAGPWPSREELPFNPVQLLRQTLAGWNWARPGVDPHLLIGWIGAAFLSGALPWRPMVFLTGDKGTGKSTLQSLIKGLLGDWLIQTINTTAAGIYQHVGQDSLPVAIDEMEAGEDNKRAVAVLELARASSSSGILLRGGDRHSGVEFQARSCFLFSSINAPPLRSQDLSRMALLRLAKLTPGVAPPVLDPRALGIVGRCILRRLIDQWPRFHDTFNAFAEELAAGGMDGRGQAQFGTLLTCADLMEHDGWDAERVRIASEEAMDVVPWRDLLRPAAMHEFEDQSENWRNCLSHLLAVRVEAWRSGTRTTVGQVVQGYHAPGEHEDKIDIGLANSLLAQAGLRIVFPPALKRRPYLAVQNQGPLVRQLFEGSDWSGAIGAGVWSSALRQGPRGRLWETGQVRVNGVQSKATLLSLDGLYGRDGIMADVEGEAENG